MASSLAKLLAGSLVLPSEDHKLMAKAKEGDVEAFGLLYNKYKNSILSFLNRRVHNRATAEELTHEVFLKAYRARHQYNTTAKFSTWLWVIARNTSLDYLRKKKEYLLSEEEEHFAHDSVVLKEHIDDAQSQLIQKSVQQDIERCWKELPNRQQEALSLKVHSELSYEEISETLESTLSAVKNLLHRAKLSLMNCLERRALA